MVRIDGTMSIVQRPDRQWTYTALNIQGSDETDLAEFKNAAGTVVAEIAADGTISSKGEKLISEQAVKDAAAGAADFADFQSRIAAW